MFNHQTAKTFSEKPVFVGRCCALYVLISLLSIGRILVAQDSAAPTFISFQDIDHEHWQPLPDGLMWRSYLAGPHEPRMSSIILYDNDDNVYWDATLGGRVGLLRYGTSDSVHPQGWQWDLEGAVMTRLDVRNAEDVTSMDYRFGTQMTRAVGPYAAKFGYYHISSHVGDEYLDRHPTFRRTNYVTESLVLGGSYQVHPALRVYGEASYSFRFSGGAEPWLFQTGLEIVPPVISTGLGGPFSAVHLNFTQSVNYRLNLTAQTGWQWQGPRSGRRLRTGFQYHTGNSTQYQFLQNSESYIAGGLWFDF